VIFDKQVPVFLMQNEALLQWGGESNVKYELLMTFDDH